MLKEWTSFYATLRNKYVNRKNNTLTDNEYFEKCHMCERARDEFCRNERQ